jgi:acyl carrier protein
MKELVKKLEEILEVENIDINKKFSDYEEWDSLAGLSIIAMLDSDYNMSMSTDDILAFKDIKSFCDKVLESNK